MAKGKAAPRARRRLRIAYLRDVTPISHGDEGCLASSRLGELFALAEDQSDTLVFACRRGTEQASDGQDSLSSIAQSHHQSELPAIHAGRALGGAVAVIDEALHPCHRPGTRGRDVAAGIFHGVGSTTTGRPPRTGHVSATASQVVCCTV